MPNIEHELDRLLYPPQNQLKGSLGISNNLVEVANRPGFVWVRLLDNANELVKVHNYKVAPIYNLPVIVEFDGNKYEVMGVDTDRYANWSTNYPYLPHHGRQHSAKRGEEGTDIVWVDSQQFLPLLVTPDSATGTNKVNIFGSPYQNSQGFWSMVGGTGVDNFISPNLSGSTLFLVVLSDVTGNFYAITGSTISSDLTGTSDILSNAPSLPQSNYKDTPIAIVKTTPNTKIAWSDIYDIRRLASTNRQNYLTLAEDDDNPSVENVTKIVVSNGTLVDHGSGEVFISTNNPLGGTQETVNETPDGVITHFTFTTAADSIWVVVDGVLQKDSDVTFTSGTTAFDLSFAPETGSDVRVVLLSPVVENSYACIQERYAAGTSAGTFTSGAWRTRTINYEQSDDGNFCSISGSQISLVAGEYICRISVPGYYVIRHQARLYNITDGATELVGTSEVAEASSTQGETTRSVISGKFSTSALKVFEIQHRCSQTKATTGFGVAANFGEDEIYTVAEFWKVG